MIFFGKRQIFIKEYEYLVRQMENREVIAPHGGFYVSGTISTYKGRVLLYREYEQYLGKEIYLNEIDYKWCENYRLWLINKGLAKNTIANYMSNLKAFLRRMHKAGKSSFDGSGIRTTTEITTAVFTTIEELKELMAMELPSGQARIRDFYVCQCFVGLRVSDTIKLLSNAYLYRKKINEKYFLEIKTQKTGEVVVIPLSPIVSEILEKRNFDFGKSFTQQYYHKTMRKIVAKSGFDRELIFSRTEGGVMQERVMRYSELIGTHTARRTFATNAYLSGINPLDIMKITGHKSFNSFTRYIRCENTAVALRLSGCDFFNTSL